MVVITLQLQQWHTSTSHGVIEERFIYLTHDVLKTSVALLTLNHSPDIREAVDNTWYI